MTKINTQRHHVANERLQALAQAELFRRFRGAAWSGEKMVATVTM